MIEREGDRDREREKERERERGDSMVEREGDTEKERGRERETLNPAAVTAEVAQEQMRTSIAATAATVKVQVCVGRRKVVYT